MCYVTCAPVVSIRVQKPIALGDPREGTPGAPRSEDREGKERALRGKLRLNRFLVITKKCGFPNLKSLVFNMS